MEKLTRVKVSTPKGDRFITFKPVLNVKPEELICETRCPYGKICDKIKDPRNMNDKNLSFIDFCGELEEGTEENSKKYSNMIPVEGSIEEAFKDFPDIFQTLLDQNPLVKINDVIESVCSGWCDDYDEGHTNCKATNNSCWMRDLFINHVSAADEKKLAEEAEEEARKKAEEESKEDCEDCSCPSV